MRTKKINFVKSFDEFNKFICTVPRILTTMIHSEEELTKLIDLVKDEEDDLEWIKDYEFVYLCSIWMDEKNLDALGYSPPNEDESCISVVSNNYDRVIFYQFFRMTFYEDMSIPKLKKEIEQFIKKEDYEMCSLLTDIIKRKEKKNNKLNKK
jgi:hypothetical protein